MHFTIRNICKKFKIQKETLRAFYYARIQREERERRELVSFELEKDERYKELQKEYLHSIQFPYRLLDPSGVRTYSAFQEKRKRLLNLGFFPWEDDKLYDCRRCHDTGSFLKDGKQMLCPCWKKGIKKALLPYRGAIENLTDPESWISLKNHKVGFSFEEGCSGHIEEAARRHNAIMKIARSICKEEKTCERWCGISDDCETYRAATKIYEDRNDYDD